MKLKLVFPILVLVIGLVVFYSCTKTDTPTENDEKSLSQPSFTNPKYPMNSRLAQRYYNKLISENIGAVAALQSDNIKMKPLWGKVYEGTSDTATFVEVPVMFNKRKSSITKKEGQTISIDDQKKLLSGSFDRLIITKAKKSGKVNQFVLTYSPTLEYIEKHKGDGSGNQFNALEKDYSGFIEVKTIDGQPLELYYASKGRITRKFKNYHASSLTSKATLVCTQEEEYCNVTWEQTCITYGGGGGSEGGGGYVECTDWEITSINYCWMECTQWQDDGSGGTGGNDDDDDPEQTFIDSSAVDDSFSSDSVYFNGDLSNPPNLKPIFYQYKYMVEKGVRSRVILGVWGQKVVITNPYTAFVMRGDDFYNRLAVPLFESHSALPTAPGIFLLSFSWHLSKSYEPITVGAHAFSEEYPISRSFVVW